MTIRTVRSNRGATGPRASLVAAVTVQGGSNLTDAAHPVLSVLGPATGLFKLRAAYFAGASRVACAAPSAWPIKVNDVTVGAYSFPAGPSKLAVVTYTHGDLLPTERLDVYGPATPDANQVDTVLTVGEAPL